MFLLFKITLLSQSAKTLHWEFEILLQNAVKAFLDLLLVFMLLLAFMKPNQGYVDSIRFAGALVHIHPELACYNILFEFVNQLFAHFTILSQSFGLLFVVLCHLGN